MNVDSAYVVIGNFLGATGGKMIDFEISTVNPISCFVSRKTIDPSRSSGKQHHLIPRILLE